MNLKATHNALWLSYHTERLFEVTKLRIWKQLTTSCTLPGSAFMLFEVTKLRIWKQLTTITLALIAVHKLFEVTKLQIWKQLTTEKTPHIHFISCLRSQSYEFESNSQQASEGGQIVKVVWGHKVTNLKATHNVYLALLYMLLLFEVTKLRIWKQLTTRRGYSPLWCGCLRSQSYEFESNSQQTRTSSIPAP